MFEGHWHDLFRSSALLPRLQALLASFFASTGHAAPHGISSFRDADWLPGHAGLTLIASLVIAATVMAIGLDVAFWLYASDLDAAGRIGVPEQMLLAMLAACGVTIGLLQSGQRRLLEQLDAEVISAGSIQHSAHYAGGQTGALLRAEDELREALQAARSEIAQQRDKITALETRRILPPHVTDERLALIGHDLRTPLNAVIGFSDLMAQEVYGPMGHPKYREYARHVRDSGRALLGVAQDVMALESSGRSNSGQTAGSQLLSERGNGPVTERPAHRPVDTPRVEVELAITRSLAGLRRTADNLSAADRASPRNNPVFGKRSVA